jgi:hypothetical protein
MSWRSVSGPLSRTSIRRSRPCFASSPRTRSAFKLLASHPLVDGPFVEALRKDPAGAAAELHIALTKDDIEYSDRRVEWAYLEKHAAEIRAALHLDLVTNSW